ncbi:hypothetical protein BJ741DRAFT_650965 [Chytriomyces cf. hyalinus JEL632]|nr:hypothetical protein BJ741DRAFT_650965 [Chytriomyces cf. hyalinus JEL632]
MERVNTNTHIKSITVGYIHDPSDSMKAEPVWSACSSSLLETWNIQSTNQAATHFLCSQHQPHDEIDIHMIRNSLIRQGGALESASTDDFILFLDHCESLTDTFSLSQMMKAYFLASKSSTQSFNREPKFIFTNTLHSLSGKLVEAAFTEDEYNPYDISVGTTATKRPLRQHDVYRSPVPPTTSMLMLVDNWRRAFEIYAHTGSQIYAAGVTGMNHELQSSCSSANERFWVSFSLNCIAGYHLPLPLLKLPQHPSNPTPQTCRINVQKLKRNLPNSLSAISLLKSRWRPSVSVIVPFYNVPHSIWFLQTLKSLSMQSFSDFEIIIVDDGSDEHLPSSALLRQFGESIQASKGLWDGQLPAINNSECKEPPSLLFGDTQSSHFFEDLPPSDISQPSLRPAQISVRIIRHKINSGLAESRNTGVRAARSHHVFFLDPDDLLSATSLEKFALTAAFSFGPLKRSPNTRVAFLHMPVTHFPDPIAPICLTSNHPQEEEAPKSHGIDSNKLYIHNANPPSPSDLLTELRYRNPLTSTAVVSKWDYIAVGGTCPRTTLRFFEDYDFWVRMAGAYGRVGIVSGEPGLFWYRRHEKGMSSKIMRDTLASHVGIFTQIKSWFQKADIAQIVDDTWLGEGRLNNPVAFGDLGRGEVERMLRLRNVRRTKTRHEEVEDDGVGSLEQFMPCYRTFETFDGSVSPHIQNFWQMRRELLNTEFGKSISSYNYHQLLDTSIRNGSLLDPVTPLPPLFPAHVFPFNPTIFPHISNPHNSSNPAVLYILPWMVTGGADLYDIHVLSAVNATLPNSSTMLVVARNLPQHPHPWSHKFLPLVEQVFHLQLLSNDSTVQNHILDYLAESRNVEIFINSRTVAGYDAIERWGKTTQNTSLNNFSFTPPRMMDILHLHHPPPDNSNWEHRSARVSRFLTNRVVVSRNLKTHLVEVLGLGDAVLGKLVNHSDPHSNSRCNNATGVTNSGRCTPLTGPDESKISIIYPPLDLTNSPASNQVTPVLQKLVDLDSSNMEVTSKAQDVLSHLFLTQQANTQPALHFLGRLTAQKDPLMWINVASKARSLYTDHSPTPPNIHFIGSGDLLQEIHRRLQLDKHLEPPNLPNFQTQHPILIKQSSSTHFHLEVSHEQVLHVLLTTSINAVTLLTSKYEGVPIAVLESLALGIPVVTMWCGGTSEVFEAATGAEIAIPFGTTINLGKDLQTVEVESLDRSKFTVTRMPLGSLIHVKCDKLIREGYKRDVDSDTHAQHKYTQAQVEAVMASEVLRFWREMEEDKTQSPLEKRAMRWFQGKRVRRKFGVKSFQSEWTRILKESWSK